MMDLLPETVEVRHGESSMNVAPEFYGIALGCLSLGVGAVDVFRDEDRIAVVFVDSNEMEFFSEFLLQHDLFLGQDGEPVIRGSFLMDFEEIDGSKCAVPTYLIDIPLDRLSDFEACMVAHTSSPSPGVLQS